MTDVQKFNPSDLMDSVREKIKATFVSLIPEDAWTAMIEKVKNDFFTSKTEYNRTIPSEFETLVKSLLGKEIEARMKEYFESPEWKETWDKNGKMVAAEAIRKIVVENSGEILMATMMQPMAYAIQNIKASLNISF